MLEKIEITCVYMQFSENRMLLVRYVQVRDIRFTSAVRGYVAGWTTFG